MMTEEIDKNRKGHHNREDLVGEHKYGDAGQIILLFVFLGIWITDSFFLHRTTWLAQNVNVYIRLAVSIPVLLFAFFISRRGLKIVFGEIRPEPEVIQKGVFGKVRHPVYLGAILLYLGLVMATFSVASLAFLIVIIVFYNYIAGYEEKLLIKTFGDDYREYMKKVPRWGI